MASHRRAIATLPLLLFLVASCMSVHALSKPPEGVCSHQEGTIFDGPTVYLSFSTSSPHGLGACCSACHDFLPCTGYNAYLLEGDMVRCDLLTGSLEGLEQVPKPGALQLLGSGAITPLTTADEMNTIRHRIAVEASASTPAIQVASSSALCGCRTCSPPPLSSKKTPLKPRPPNPPPASPFGAGALLRRPTTGLAAKSAPKPKPKG